MFFQKPNSSQFEVLWFHQALHKRTIGNLYRIPSSRYGYPSPEDLQEIISSRIPVSAPFAVSRVATLLSLSDLAPDQAGDQFTGTMVQLTVSRDSLTSHPTDISLSLQDTTAGNTLAECYPGLGFVSGDSLYVGLQWLAGTPRHPQIGLQDSAGPFEQELVHLEGLVNVWGFAPESYSLELDLLNWRAEMESFSLFGPSMVTPAIDFEVWYTPDTTRPAEDGYATSSVAGDTLSWRTELRGAGFVAVCATDSTGQYSDTVFVEIPVAGEFKWLTFSAAQLVFDWGSPNTLRQQLLITNHGIGAVNLNLWTDDERLELDSTSMRIPGGGSFRTTWIEMTSPPQSLGSESHSLYIGNDRGWPTTKMDILARSDIQTSVDDEPVTLPVSFALSDVYPNPSRGSARLKITSEILKSFKVEIYNVLGQLLRADRYEILGEFEAPVRLEPTGGAPMAAGVYFVRVSSGTESLLRKVVLLK